MSHDSPVHVAQAHNHVHNLICWYLLLFDIRGTKENYQDELREIPANFDERRTGVSPHILDSPGPRHLKSKIIAEEFVAQNLFLICNVEI